MAPTIKSKLVASFQKINVEHKITICNFAAWRENMEFFGDLVGKFDVPIPHTEGLSKVNCRNLINHVEYKLIS